MASTLTIPFELEPIIGQLRDLLPPEIMDVIRASMDPLTGKLDPEMAQMLRDEMLTVLADIPDEIVYTVLKEMPGSAPNLPASPLEQAIEIDPKYRDRLHLRYLSDRLAQAVHDVENGQNRFMQISMPPRSGKSTMTSLYLPTWVLRGHPDWKVGLVSYGATFAASWGRAVRRLFEGFELGVNLAPDATAASGWETVDKGAMYSRGIGSEVTGIGFKVLVLDDLVKGFAEAHSPTYRDLVWNRWTNDIYSRLEPPFLVLAVGTRWHENDFLGRLASKDYEGDSDRWEKITFPAIAEGSTDILGREAGEPLFSPLLDETPEQALERWRDTKATVGNYAWNAIYQQHPSPAKGTVFDMDTFRYWTTNPDSVTEDNDRVVYLDLEALATEPGRWLDSWDCAFKAKTDSDYVVGQRWVRRKANRYLIAQKRGQWTFTQTLRQMKNWSEQHNPITSPFGHLVHLHLIEDKANGTAILDTLHDEISGLKPIDPKTSKESRARAVTPEIESGNVYLPYPGDPGNEWVTDLLDELRNFNHGTNDDQVDAMTQALTELRDTQTGSVTVPGSQGNNYNRDSRVDRNVAAAAKTDLSKPGRGTVGRRPVMGTTGLRVVRGPGR